MPLRPTRICCRCHRDALPQSSFCEIHKNARAQEDAERKEKYKRPHNSNSKAWLHTRDECFYRYLNICAQLTNGVRCTELATEAHHIEPWHKLVARGIDYLDQRYLVALCKQHHTLHTVAERTGVPVPGSFAKPSREHTLC